jgi:hypothetical protein
VAAELAGSAVFAGFEAEHPAAEHSSMPAISMEIVCLIVMAFPPFDVVKGCMFADAC